MTEKIFSNSKLALILFSIALFFRQFERLYFVIYTNVKYPEVYLGGLPFGLFSGSLFSQIAYFLIFCILLSIFVANQKLRVLSSFGLMTLLLIGNQDGVYIGKGLVIFLPMIIIFPWIIDVGRTQKAAKIIFFLYLPTTYFLSAFSKTGESWLNGEAIGYFLQHKQITYPMAQILMSMLPLGLIKTLTFLTLFMEYSVIFIFILFLFNLAGRKVIFIYGIAFITFHLIIGFVSILNSFSLAMISCWLLVFSVAKDLDGISIKELKLTWGLIPLIYVFLSLLISNLVPGLYQNREKLFFLQKWQLVAPEPGLNNRVYEVLRNGDIVLTSESLENKRNDEAFLTSMQRNPRIKKIFLSSLCEKDNDILETNLHEEPISLRQNKIPKRVKKNEKWRCSSLTNRNNGFDVQRSL